jgi:DNA gyrase subunit A
LIADEDIVLTITHFGYIKRLPVTTYRSQRRGGRGITGISPKEEDFVEHLFITSTHQTILFFTNQGRVYRLKGFEVPEAGRQARGTAIINLVQVEPGERINAVIPIKDFDNESFLLMCTKKGIVKKTALTEFQTNRKGGLIAINLDDQDELIAVKLTDGSKEAIIVTEKGQAIRFPETDVRTLRRASRGVKGITLAPNDLVVGMDIPREGAALLVITSAGIGKRTALSEYRIQSRGGKGVKTMKLTKKHGLIVGIKVVSESDELMVITAEGVIIRTKVRDISETGRDTQGVKIMKPDNDDRIVALARVVGVDKDEE